ncbi:MAG: D-ribose pyranase [Propionibacteriaceae bacterium]
MLKRGILNPQLAGELARLGHTHTVVIADCGLPLPRHGVVVDLSLCRGVPTFVQVLDAVLDQIVIEGATVATQAQGTVVEEWVNARIGEVNCAAIDHEELKRQVQDATLIIRTGEDTAYANVILTCSVPF